MCLYTVPNQTVNFMIFLLNEKLFESPFGATTNSQNDRFLRLSGYQKDEGHYVTDSFERDRHSASQLAKRLGYVKQ